MIARRTAGELYQITCVDEEKVASRVITITIFDANPHAFSCAIDPEYYLDVGSGGSYTPMDIDLSRFNLDPGEFVKIIIKLRNDNLFFMPNEGEKKYAVTAGTEVAAGYFCNLMLDEFDDYNDNLAKEASFVCEIVGGPTKVHPYNVGLLIRFPGDPIYEFPVIYDPKVRNDGG